MKRCSKCLQIKPLTKFYKNKNCTDGHVGQCADCWNEWRRDNWRRKQSGLPLRGRQDSCLLPQPRHRKQHDGWLLIDARGYLVQSIYQDGKQTTRYAHRIVWEAAFGPVPRGYEVHHNDGDRLNNNLDNLRCMPHRDHVRLHKSLIPKEAHKCLLCGGEKRVSKIRVFDAWLCSRCKHCSNRAGVLTRCQSRSTYASRGELCSVDGCSRPVRAKGLCHSHHAMARASIKSGRKQLTTYLLDNGLQLTGPREAIDSLLNVTPPNGDGMTRIMIATTLF